jgi:hypothetical protein
MDAQDFRSLQEAYMEVVENQQLDEAEYVKFNDGRKSRVTGMRGEFKKPQPLNPLPKSPRKSGVDKLDKGRQAYNKSRKVASRNLMRQEEQVDIYDIILSHLLDEGYAETPEAAEAIMGNMSEEWRQSILG